MHQFVVPFLDLLVKEQPYVHTKYVKFIKTFRMIYKEYGCPASRLWQRINIENLYESSSILKQTRKVTGVSLKAAAKENDLNIITSKHLSRIENGLHAASPHIYRKLMRNYGRHGEMIISVLEGASSEILRLYHSMKVLLKRQAYKDAKYIFNQMREKCQKLQNRLQFRQVFLHYDTIFKLKERCCSTVQALDGLFRALKLTIDADREDEYYFVFSQEEKAIIYDIIKLSLLKNQYSDVEKWDRRIHTSIKFKDGEAKTAIWAGVGYLEDFTKKWLKRALWEENLGQTVDILQSSLKVKRNCDIRAAKNFRQHRIYMYGLADYMDVTLEPEVFCPKYDIGE